MNVDLNLIMTPEIKFNVKFYLIVIVFIVFDIETVFLLPWNITFQK